MPSHLIQVQFLFPVCQSWCLLPSPRAAALLVQGEGSSNGFPQQQLELLYLRNSAKLLLLQPSNATSMCDSCLALPAFLIAASSVTESVECSSTVCVIHLTGSTPSQKGLGDFLASARDLESSQKISPRSFLPFPSSLGSFLSLSPSAPSPLSSQQGSAAPFYYSSTFLLENVPEIPTLLQLQPCQSVVPVAGTHQSSLGHGQIFPCDLGTT